MKVEELCYCDMLSHGDDGWYIVRRIWRRPVWSEDGKTLLTYILEGFDLIESKSGTLRQVNREELQQQIDEGNLTFYHPPTVRRVIGL